MTAKECIINRRSIRRFKPDAVDTQLLKGIVETASYAPSWKHTQITRYIAVEGALKDKIADEGTKMFPNNGNIIKNAPVLIAVTVVKGVQTAVDGSEESIVDFAVVSCAAQQKRA